MKGSRSGQLWGKNTRSCETVTVEKVEYTTRKVFHMNILKTYPWLNLLQITLRMFPLALQSPASPLQSRILACP